MIVSISPSVLPCGVALVSQTPGQGAKDSVPALGTQGAQCWQVAPAVPCTTGQLYWPHHYLLSFEQQINLDQNQKELWPQPQEPMANTGLDVPCRQEFPQLTLLQQELQTCFSLEKTYALST